MKYYHIIRRNLVAKGEGWFDNYIYQNGEWVEDTKCLVSDRLFGYDSSEPADSPYGIGNTDMLEDIETITEEEAMKLIAQQENGKK